MNDHLLTADSPRADTYRVRVSGVFDTAAGAHLLRQLDAWAHHVDTHGGTTRTVVADLTGVTAASLAGLKALPHAERTVGRRRCVFGVVGADRRALGGRATLSSCADVRLVRVRWPAPQTC